MTYQVQIDRDGALRLPENLVRSLGIKPGDMVSVGQSGMRIIVDRDEAHHQALTRLRAALKGYSVDQFLAERRADWGE